jgi:hypothetical protein
MWNRWIASFGPEGPSASVRAYCSNTRGWLTPHANFKPRATRSSRAVLKFPAHEERHIDEDALRPVRGWCAQLLVSTAARGGWQLEQVEADAGTTEFVFASDNVDRRTQRQRVNEDRADDGRDANRQGNEEGDGMSVLHLAKILAAPTRFRDPPIGAGATRSSNRRILLIQQS